VRPNFAQAHRLSGDVNGDPVLPRGVIVLLGLASVVVSVAGLRSVADIIGPVVLALMLTVTASPLSTWLRRHGAPAWVAAAALLATVYTVLAALGVALVLSVTRLVDLMPQYQSQRHARRCCSRSPEKDAAAADALSPLIPVPVTGMWPYRNKAISSRIPFAPGRPLPEIPAASFPLR
jgi:predicted PurR-regulated permease PerM